MTRDELVNQLLDFAQTDTVLFFEPYPAKLNALQHEKWGAVLDRFKAKGADLMPTETLTVAPLSDQTKALIRSKLAAFAGDNLLWFRELAGAFRSVLLAFAACDDEMTFQEAFDASCLEELFQNEFWQTDEEALKARTIRQEAALKAFQVLKGKNE